MLLVCEIQRFRVKSASCSDPIYHPLILTFQRSDPSGS